MAIAAYAERFEVVAGTELAIYASSGAGPIADVTVQRPAAASAEVTGWRIDTVRVDPGTQPLVTGSYLELPLCGLGSAWTFVAAVCPTADRDGAVLASLETGSGHLRAVRGSGGVTVETATGTAGLAAPALRVGRWCVVAIAAAGDHVSVALADATTRTAAVCALASGPSAVLRIGADVDAADTGGQLDAVVADPLLFSRALRDDELVGLAGGVVPDGLTASWRLAPGRPAAVVPCDGDQPDGIAVGHPVMGVLGPRTGVGVLGLRAGVDAPASWRDVPGAFNAVRVHRDALDDARWPVTHVIRVPPDAPSDLYTVTLTTERGARDAVPFFVVAKQPGRHAKLAFLAPTLTYLAYADEQLPEDLYEQRCQDVGIDFARDNDLRSQYDTHADGAGVVHATLRRPLPTVRLDHRYPLSGTPHGISVDIALLAFCHRADLAYEVITDHHLDELAHSALAPYRVLMTGSHPEYWTPAMRASLARWLEGGGRLAYLGGNGMYWVTAIDPHDRAVSEVRRGPDGITTWQGPRHESRLTLCDHEGGLWRDTATPEHQLLGVTTCAMGFSRGSAYLRTERGREPEHARFFAGCTDGAIGRSGSVLDGAASYEIDAVPGSQRSQVQVLATATDFGADVQVDAHPDGPRTPKAEIAYRRVGRGEVFSVGSVGWLGALEDHNVATITANVLRAFLDAR